MNSVFVDCCKPSPIKKITFATLYQIYEDSDDSISDSECSDYEEKPIANTEKTKHKLKCTEIFVPKDFKKSELNLKTLNKTYKISRY